MVPDTPEVEAVLLGEEGAAAGMADGDLCIDMSTIAPTATKAIESGWPSAESTSSTPCHVTAEAEDATHDHGGRGGRGLRTRPTPVRGDGRARGGRPTGHGEMAKLINNVLAAVNAAALGEGLQLARAAGLDTDRLRQVVAAGAGSTMLELKAEPMLNGDFDALFKLEHMLKDMRHCIREAEALGLELRRGPPSSTRRPRTAATGRRFRRSRHRREVTDATYFLERPFAFRNNGPPVPPQ